MTGAILRMLLVAAASLALRAADPALDSAYAKMEKLENGQEKPGEVVALTPAEINAWVAAKVPEEVPHGMRDPRIELGTDTASASAMVDFLKMEQSRGKTINRAMAMMLEGERPLKVSVRVTSAGGKCTVYLTRVEVAGVGVEGAVLEFLINTFFMPLYPSAKIGEPFEIGFDIGHFEIRPDGLRITIKK